MGPYEKEGKTIFSDLGIAQAATLKPVAEIAAGLGERWGAFGARIAFFSSG
jgi:hypothetical protein